MNKLITATADRIHAWHTQWPNAAVLWSGGKDSTAMLHVLRHYCELDLPIVQYREPKLRERYAYSDQLIKEWGLTIYDYPPTRMAIADGPDVENGTMRFDMLKYYQWGQTAVVMSLGTERPKEGERFLCGVTDFRNARPATSTGRGRPSISARNTKTPISSRAMCRSPSTYAMSLAVP